MKPAVRLLSLALAAVAVLFALGLLAINLYIQSPGAHQKICSALSRSLGLPVSVFRISYSPWSGLVLKDVLVTDPGSPRPLLRADQVKARCDYFAVFRHKLLIRQVILQRVDVALPVTALSQQARAADLRAPGSPPLERPAPSPPAAAGRASRGALAAPDIEPSRRRLSVSFLVQIQRFKVANGTVVLLSRDGAPLAAIRDLEFSARLEHGVYSGRMQAASATLTDALVFEDLSSPLQASSAGVELPALQAKLYGGELAGKFRLDASSPPYRYDLNLEASGVNVNDMVTHAGSVLQDAHGILQAKLDLHGAATNVGLNSGEGNMRVMSGYIDQYPLLQEIGRWTQIDELQRLQFKEAHSHFRITGPDVSVEDLRLLSKNCDVRLRGQIAAAQGLHLTGRLTINQFLSQKIPNELEENFISNPDDHTRYLDFSVTGPLSRPQTNLFDRIIGDKRKLFRKLLGGERRDRARESGPKPIPSETIKE